MSKNELMHSTVEFDLKKNGKLEHISFDVWHNLPNVLGLSLQNAVENWVHRTTIFTAHNLCDYIQGKNTGYICQTKPPK